MPGLMKKKCSVAPTSAVPNRKTSFYCLVVSGYSYRGQTLKCTFPEKNLGDQGGVS